MVTKYCDDIITIYANAFFEYLRGNNLLESVSKEVLLLQKNISLVDIISPPIYSYKEQMDLLEVIAKNLSLSKEIFNLLGILANNKRLYALDAILEMFNMILTEYYGNKIVEAIVSYEMSEEDQKSFKENLEKKLSSKIALTYKIDPSILGGVIIKIDNKMFDASLKTKFYNLKNNIEREIALL
jgi:F-type H+-transporting ATPase subunit delta